ncbi:peptidase [Klebsiella pneumoniae]|uniref:peptidase n=1 Tax=Klebsiella pneumoniae TaxID=573 RepID=UPI001C80CC41|nr:peptidase [Klebsiella pneumoniae]MBX4686734.1 peptidase [Klebsiella pneumoniae]MDP1489208.1 peptidase [Klebsiella pneumoniae]
MTLFERLLHRRLCIEQPADGGAAPAASEPSAPGSGAASQSDQSAQQDGENPSVDGEGQQEKTENQDGEQQKTEKEQKQEGAPEKYEFQAGEGVELDAEALKDFEPVARELNLTNEQAQKLVDAYPKILAGVQQRQADAWQAQTEEWAATVKADKEIGGDKLTANLGVAQRALDTFGTPELKEYLNGTGLGNHPELVKAFVKVGKAMSEDGVVTGKESGQRSAAEVLYGK